MSSFKRRQPGNAKALAQATSKSSESKNEDGNVPKEGLAKDGGESIKSIEWSQNDNKLPLNETRTNVSLSSGLPIGLKPSPFPSIVPLFSSGLASLDDLICGYGIPSSCLLAFCPATGLTSISAESGFDSNTSSSNNIEDVHHLSRTKIASSSRTTIESLQNSEIVLKDLMAYGIAQGLISGQRTLVLGQNARQLVENRVPSRITSRDAMNTVVKEDRDESEQDMKIAFRYAHRPKFKTTVDEPTFLDDDNVESISPEHRFRAPFDMSKRLSKDEIKRAEESQAGDGLCIADTTKYEEIIKIIEKEFRSQSNRTDHERSPALRIHLVSLGSKAFGKAGESFDRRIVQLSKFLMQLRRLIKSFTLNQNPTQQSSLNIICSFTISSDLLHPPRTTFVTQHLLRFVDSQILLSDFTLNETLQKAYAGYGGSICLLKGPSIGAILPQGEHRSILRGGGGEAGVENDVGWRRRKRGRGLVLETLHEDVDAGQSSTNTTTTNTKDEKKDSNKQSDDIEDTAQRLPRKSALNSTNVNQQRDIEDTNSSPPSEGVNITARPTRSSPGSPGKVGTAKRFEGLKSLRERGLRAAAAAKAAAAADSSNDEHKQEGSNEQINIEME